MGGGTGCVCFLGHGGAGTSATAWRQGIVCKQTYQTYGRTATTTHLQHYSIFSQIEIYVSEKLCKKI